MARSPDMHLFERTTLIASAVVGLSIAGWMALRSEPSARTALVRQPVIVPVPTPPNVIYVTEEAPEPVQTYQVLDPPAGCGAKSNALTEVLRGWLLEPSSHAIGFDPQRGIAFAHSEVDTGYDGVLPKRFGPEAKLACGSEAWWLRSHVREKLRRHYELTCCDGVCTYLGMEFAPTGHVRFVERDGQWLLTGWSETYNAGLAPDYAAANEAFVATAMKHLDRARCDETPGVALE